MPELDLYAVPNLLDRAADHLAEYGWTQGGFVHLLEGIPVNECPACAFGAINLAAGVDVDDDTPVGLRYSAAEALLQHLGTPVPEDVDGCWDPVIWPVATWNDVDGRTAEQVITALREAAAAERGRTDA